MQPALFFALRTARGTAQRQQAGIVQSVITVPSWDTDAVHADLWERGRGSRDYPPSLCYLPSGIYARKGEAAARGGAIDRAARMGTGVESAGAVRASA